MRKNTSDIWNRKVAVQLDLEDKGVARARHAREGVVKMVSRPYRCPLCHSSFRNESGMNWHVAHRHEIPNAFDALGKEYEAKSLHLREENARLLEELEKLMKELEQTKADLFKEKGERIANALRIEKLNEELQKAAVAIVSRDLVIEQRLGIKMPYPLEQG